MNEDGIVIDLGTTRYDPSTEDTGPSQRLVLPRWRTVAATLAGILVLSAGGAAPAPAPPLWEVHTVPFGPVDGYHLDGDLLVTTTPVGDASGPVSRVTGYDLVDGRQLWSGEFRTGSLGGIRATPTGGSLLIEGGPEGGPRQTTALNPRTGQHRWSLPYSLRTLPGESIALVWEYVFAPESRLAADHLGSPSQRYLSDGQIYTEPPIGEIVRAVELDTGRVRWESPQLDNSFLLPATGDQPAVLLTTAAGGGVEVRDLTTGTAGHRLDWPGGELTWAVRVDGVVAVSRSGPNPGVTAYSADLRQQRWSRSLPDPDTFLAACGPVLCQFDRNGLATFDPATGEARWQLSGRAHPIAIGSWLITPDDDGEELRLIIDPLTGRSVGDLGGWQLAASGWFEGRIDGDLPTLVTRPNPVAQHTEVGLLDLAEPAVRPLVVLPHAVRGCQVARRFLACRSAGGQLRVWRYELPRTLRGVKPPG